MHAALATDEISIGDYVLAGGEVAACVDERLLPGQEMGVGGLEIAVAALQAVAIAFFLTPLWTVLGDWMHWVNGALMTAAVIATVLSGVDYLVKAIRHGRQAP